MKPTFSQHMQQINQQKYPSNPVSFVLYSLMLALLFWQPIAFASLSVRVSPSKIQENDTFNLLLTSDEAQTNHLPNLTPLQKEFTILGTQRNVSVSMVNGQTSSQSQWIILLRPNKTGTLTIPAITVGNQQTKPTTITVITGASQDKSSSEMTNGIELKTEISEKTPLINQQVLYTVKLLNNQRIVNAEYRPPHIEDALMIPLGDGKHYQTNINGESYAVEEQQYAIFPQKSGPLTITPPSFNATLFNAIPGHIHLKGKPTTLSVKPAPDNVQPWLPAQKISLTETYEKPSHTLHVGDTLIRTVHLKAVAVPAQLLPTLPFKGNQQFSVYPETPELKNSINNGELVGNATIKITYLLNQNGNVTIPKLSVRWFNTTTGKTETTTLPPRMLQVTANSATKTNGTQTIRPSDTIETTSEASSSQSSNASRLYPLVIGFAAAWLIIALIWSIRKRVLHKPERVLQKACSRLQEACMKNQPNLARTALLGWAKAQWPEANLLNLSDIAKLTRDPDFKKHLAVLSETLYNPLHQQRWQGDGLWRCFKTFRQTKPSSNHHHSDLPPINP